MGQEVAGYTLLVVVSLSIGYWAGIKTRLPSRESPIPGNESGKDRSETSSMPDDGNISLQIDQSNECKMVLIVRTDLGMSSGKIAAQCSHATLACFKKLLSTNPMLLKQWEHAGQMKIALRCANEDDLLLMEAQAQSLNLCARSIQDAGRTQIAPGSRTVLGIIGPTRLVNRVTGHLHLL